VRVAYVPIMKFAPLYVAAERGLFDALGLDVTIDRVASGTEAIAFLEQGQIDVGGIAIVVSLWNGWSQGLDLRVIAPGGLEPFEGSPTKLMLRADLADEVTEIADLRGRTVAVAGGPGSGGEYLAAKALERGGLTIRDVDARQPRQRRHPRRPWRAGRSTPASSAAPTPTRSRPTAPACPSPPTSRPA
jgi:NitT/TauT family transport system substrate-binding protein